MPIPEADAESENELDCVGMLEERLRDTNIVEEEGDDFLQNRGGDRDNIVPTPPEQFSNCDVSSQYLFAYARPLPLKRNLPLQLRRHQYASSSAQRTRHKFRPRLPGRSFLDETAYAHRYLLHFPYLRQHPRLRKSQKRK